MLHWFGVEENHDAVLVALVEHFGRDHHALACPDALALVNPNLHRVHHFLCGMSTWWAIRAPFDRTPSYGAPAVIIAPPLWTPP
jgi:hypothetical protein